MAFRSNTERELRAVQDAASARVSLGKGGFINETCNKTQKCKRMSVITLIVEDDDGQRQSLRLCNHHLALRRGAALSVPPVPEPIVEPAPRRKRVGVKVFE